ncbi:MAG: class I adenylate-forming enzyme family protein [Pseudotabrizicola sp.]|uniref:class I adenylate-forming enzyme family protein n=1 Tax=Pseudotabrizicola sp. TaxID=2939647 RepID=UPI00271EC2BE|nr:class I adenylate-forming enzyme family protein [Pseudotabrizicola sp.]MDO8882153.1 class I adenylate-forming enzyme family protein [Pseudotabrizicola sp.]MDP2082668.1 class I adenylate-forming enzyme family protein [Pseudotabrizicola sp.]MDZ7573564.1 class I adenylate-forming enzyme family protein [Pseudotabrizicola sp.]
MLALIDTGPAPTVPAPFNMAQHVLAKPAARLPDKLALQIIKLNDADAWSYARLLAAVLGCATGLRAAGLQPGDRILMRLANQVEFPILFLGALAAGMVPVATSAQLTSAEISPMAARIAPRLIVASSGVALPDGQFCPIITDADIRAMERLPPAPFHLGDPDRPGYIIFTSGTSGSPMAVVHAHRAILARSMMHAGWEGLGESDRLLHAGAFNWTYTLGTGLMDPWCVGATALIPGTGVEAADLPALIQRHEATIFAAAPGVYRQMLRATLPALPRLRHGLSAGEKLGDDTRAAWVKATGTPICEALGMSEISTFVSESPTRAAPAGATGFAQTGRRIAALGPDLSPVPRGTPGQMAIDRRDPGLMLGYLDAPEATAARLSGGWFLTGDSIVIDDQGAVTYLGRDDDQMNAGGYRVSPVEVEAAMARFPGLLEAAVTEIEVKPGVTVIACFYTAAAPLDDTALNAHAATHLARYKQPRLFRHLPALPRGANAKLNRRALRAMGTL